MILYRQKDLDCQHSLVNSTFGCTKCFYRMSSESIKTQNKVDRPWHMFYFGKGKHLLTEVVQVISAAVVGIAGNALMESMSVIQRLNKQWPDS